jgi:hypothetical protein
LQGDTRHILGQTVAARPAEIPHRRAGNVAALVSIGNGLRRRQTVIDPPT